MLPFVLVSRSLELRPSPLPGPPGPLAWSQQGCREGCPPFHSSRREAAVLPGVPLGAAAETQLLCCDVGFLRSWGGRDPSSSGETRGPGSSFLPAFGTRRPLLHFSEGPGCVPLALRPSEWGCRLPLFWDRPGRCF